MCEKRPRLAKLYFVAEVILYLSYFKDGTDALNHREIIVKAKEDIKSYNYPFHYRNNINTTFRFNVSSINACWLNLIVVDFSVQPSNGCTKDYLQVGDNRLCGDLPEGYTALRRVEQENDSMTVQFITDSCITRHGFLIKHNFVECLITTTTENPSTSSFVFNCPFENGLFPHERLCKKYYECKNNIAVLKECPPGKLFKEEVVENERFADCEDEDKVNCKGREKVGPLLDIKRSKK
ncbi:scavenger receptor cysteine-rich domain-containing protein DMBT1-like isoform X2 [Tachypleus tridentatus]